MSIEKLLDNLWCFVEERDNKRLKFAVNPSVVPFRGKPFGKKFAHEIDNELKKGTRAEILWFGSNPNAPDSLHRLLWGKKPMAWREEGHKTEKMGGNKKFKKQYKKLKNGGQKGRRATDDKWDPLESPKGGWVHYQKALAGALGDDLTRVVMANAIPWGSHTTDELLEVLFEFDEDLLERMLKFSNQLVKDMIKALDPKLIIVPLSLARNKTLHEVVKKRKIKYQLLLPENSEGNSAQYINKAKNTTRNFNYSVQKYDNRTYLFVPHPSSLRIASGARQNFQSKLIEIFTAHLK